jgi:hypothetical protein
MELRGSRGPWRGVWLTLPRSGSLYSSRKQATVEIVEHASEDDLERYAMRTLPAPESECMEEHCLICAECRDRLESTDQYVSAMRSAAAKIRGGTCE